MNISQWINGKLEGYQSVEVCRQVASCLKRAGWSVLELYEIHTLVMFSPSYGEVSNKTEVF